MSGDTSLRYLRYRNTKTGQVTKHHAADGETFGVFVFAGYEPATELVRGLAELNDQAISSQTGAKKQHADGLYAAGDVCVKPLRQVVTAVGDGALAAHGARNTCSAAMQENDRHPSQSSGEPGRRNSGIHRNKPAHFLRGACRPSSIRYCPDGRSTGPAAVSGRKRLFRLN